MHAGLAHDEDGPPREHPEESVMPSPSRPEFPRMVNIPTGTFKRGSTFEENKRHKDMCRKYDSNCQLWWFNDEHPDHLVFLDSYWIDLFEVTNEKYLEFVLVTGHRSALDETCETDKCREGNLWEGNSFPSRISRQPVTQVSWYDADAYCRWRGKRLPSEAEWEKAARGPSGSMYPWGSGSPKHRAAYGRKWQGVYTMTDVGTYSNGVSLYGVFDMAGNVWEWVDDWYDPKYYNWGKKKNPRGPVEGEFKVVRGGSWVNHPDTLRSAFRRWSRPKVRFNDTGFRCARDDDDETEKN
ncbi:MAG: SUMF1/EgtB/PvdO family nonheme iron enzyme [Nitrospinae bacterium]|nr:SUMF1/EgtB/PvdO family nonheme iron enzyme [Nitrospinota bacterium]